jgi:hypothetical protein
MSVSAPQILFPTSEPAFSTNLSHIYLSGISEIGVSSILVNGVTAGTTVDPSGNWSWSGTLRAGENIFVVQSVKDNDLSTSDQVSIIYDAGLDTTQLVDLPTGIRIRQGRNNITLAVPLLTDSSFVGFNFYGSENVGGGSTGYTLLNTAPISNVVFFEDQRTQLSKVVTKSGSQETTTVVENVERINFTQFVHDRLNQPLGNSPITEKNHYVVSAVIFDPFNKVLIESGYSEELSGVPIVIDTRLKEIDQRTEQDFRLSLIDQMLQANEGLDLKPGQVLRDVVIDPASSLFARMFTILRFINTSQSFPTLLAFDDADGDSVSDPVLTSAEKNSLRLALLVPEDSADLVQQLIDSAFDKLAGNVNKTRLPARESVGEITVYTKKRPDKDAVVQAGAIVETLADQTNNTPSVRFECLSGFVLRVADLENYFNATNNRYEFKIPIRASVAGTIGNVEAGKIVSPASGFDPVFAVVNDFATAFGEDLESNSSLAQRALLAFMSVDSGTEAGYFSNTVAVKGVTRAKIVSANAPLMQRDLDPIREIHSFGKVDIYVQGKSNRQVSETFGFAYKKVLNERFYIQNRNFMRFNTINPLVDEVHPIFKLIEVRNVSRNLVYDLTNAVITNDGNVIDLDETILANQLIGLGINDIIRVSYVYRRSDNIKLNFQPVERIISVSGSKSGDLTEDNFQLYRKDDPLLLGRSTSATDEVQFTFANGVPNAEMEVVTNENIVLIGTQAQALSNVGVDLSTLYVTDTDANPYVVNVDYEIIPGDAKTQTSIARTEDSSIPSGSVVYVSYESGELMTVNYEINDILTTVQDKIDEMKHLTADVVVKSAQPTLIDLDFTVSLDSGADPVTVDRNIRTALTNFLSSAKLGQSIYQSDIISVVESVIGVRFVVVPLSKMVKSSGVQVIREVLANPQFFLYQTGSVSAYRSIEKLNSNTTDRGGPDYEFKGVFENDFLLEMQVSDTTVSGGSGRAYISENGTLIVSPRKGGDPNGSKWSVTYVVGTETGAKDIIISQIEYVQIKSLSITYANTGQVFSS